MAVNKPVAIGISIVLCVGVVIGVVAIVHNSNSKDKESVSSQKKAVTNMCSSTRSQDTCEKTLGSANSEDPKELMSKSVASTEEAVKKFYDHVSSLVEKAKDNNRTQEALETCKALIEASGMHLQSTIQGIKDADVSSFQDSINDLRVWIGMALTNGESCLEGFDDGGSTNDINRDSLSKAMAEADTLNLIALDIVSGLKDILPKFGININLDIPNTQRRLLSSDGESPEWLSTADHRLLAGANPKPNAVVGPGDQFKKIMDAVNAYPKGHQGRYVIYVKAGVYKENVIIGNKMKDIFMYGDGPDKTKVTGNKSFKGGVGTSQTATFGVDASGFIAKDMGFENTAGWEGHQAVAFRANGDMTALYNCRFDGYQDTFYPQNGRQFYKRCHISGTLDFIMGDAAAIIQDCTIEMRTPGPKQYITITAPKREDPKIVGALVIHNSKIVGAPGFNKAANRVYLGRPWNDNGVAIFMESDMGDAILPEGWVEWETRPNNMNTAFLSEYKNRGPASDVSKRDTRYKAVKPQLDKAAAMQYTAERMLQSKGPWLQQTGFEFTPGLLS